MNYSDTDDLGSEPAFPRQPVITDLGRRISGQSGLTTRQLFAAMTLQGLLSNSDFEKSRSDDAVVEKAVQYADKLLKELSE